MLRKEKDMGYRVTLNLDANTRERLEQLAGSLGCSEELAAIYAVRLVSACVREGLIRDVPARAWPEEAQPLLQGEARVLNMPSGRAHNTNY